MKKINYSIITLFAILLLLIIASCKRDVEDLEPATFPTTAEVFIDGFSGGLNYAAFGGSKVTAFDVDTEVKYSGTSSMKFAIPDAGDPAGGYAGGVYHTEVGRDLSSYDALTFWVKASKAAAIDVIGFGNDLAESKYQATIAGLPVNTNWQKIIIPIPDPAKLTEERGMLFYSEAPEEGKGYTFWIDEVKFEKLGTLAHNKPSILEGQDQTIATETGDNLTIGGLFTNFNLPTGVDQRVEVAPSYYTFSSSNPAIATVSDLGVISVLDQGEAIISAKLGGVDAIGSLKVESSGQPIRPLTTAPTPDESADQVISMFSNAYTNVPIDTWNTRWEFSTAEDSDLQINGDDVKRYKQLNFVGIEFSSETIDASNMTHFHIDIWTPDPTDPPAAFKILLIDFGADGNFGGDDDASHELSFTSPTLVTENWISLDIPLSSFSGLITKAHLAQMVFSGDLPTVFIDNVYFYNDDNIVGGPSQPTEMAPMPTHDAANVISVFSDAYSNIEGTDFNPDWGQATVVTEESIAGNNTLVYRGLNYQGLQLGSNQNVSEMTHLHIDYWTANSSALNAFLISSAPVETAVALSVPTSSWASVDIPLADFSPVDLADLIQFKFDGNGDIYLDNIYFYNDSGTGMGGGNMPSEAAPAPVHDATDIISVFSDAYSNIEGTDFNPDWGQATVVSQEPIAGNNALIYRGLNYQGLQLGSNQNVSEMTHLHIDYWTANSSALNAFLISSAPVETAVALSVPTSSWASVDIPLADFSPVDLADLIQFKFDGNGDIYLDNIYFYNDSGTGMEGGNMPSEAASAPVHDAANVISVFSDAYSNIEGTDLNPNWGQETVVSQELIADNNTLVFKGLNYQGFQLGSSQNVSEMNFLHIDFWTGNSTALNTFLISSGPVETAYALTVPTSGWVSVDIPLADFSPVDLGDIIQFKFDGNGDIYLDNIYFHK